MNVGDIGVLGRGVDSLLSDGDHGSMSGQVNKVTALRALEVVAVNVARLPQVPSAPLACLEQNHCSTSLHTLTTIRPRPLVLVLPHPCWLDAEIAGPMSRVLTLRRSIFPPSRMHLFDMARINVYYTTCPERAQYHSVSLLKHE